MTASVPPLGTGRAMASTPPGTPGTTTPSATSGDTPLMQALFADPASFSLVQAVRLLHVSYGQGQALVDYVREHVRIRPHLSLAFAPSDLVAIERLPEVEGTDAQAPRFRLTVSVLALYGTSSPLPTFYTEDLLTEKREDRTAARDFLDLLNDGLYSLFLWAGWFRCQPDRALLEQHDEALLERFLALVGLSDSPLHRGGRALRLLPLAGLLTQFPRSAEGLRCFLSDLLHLPVAVEQCVTRMAAVPLEQQCRLGYGHALGESALLGSQVEDRGGKIAIHAGALSAEDFDALIPGGRLHATLQELITFYCTEPLHVDLHLYLAREAIPPCRLGDAPAPAGLGIEQDAGRGTAGGPACRLGHDSWLGVPARTAQKGPAASGMSHDKAYDDTGHVLFANVHLKTWSQGA